MEDKEKRPAEMEAPTGTVTMTFPDYNMFAPEEQEKAVKIMELLWMGLQINGMQARQKEFTGGLPTVFGRIYGNIGVISIEVFRNGWDEKCACQMRNTRDTHFDERLDGEYEHARSFLHGILEDMKHDE